MNCCEPPDLAAVRHHVPGVPHDEHVPHLGLCEPKEAPLQYNNYLICTMYIIVQLVVWTTYYHSAVLFHGTF